MLQNLIDKYNDLVDSGKSSEAAYNIATASIGDIHELIRQIEKEKKIIPCLNKIMIKDENALRFYYLYQ